MKYVRNMQAVLQCPAGNISAAAGGHSKKFDGAFDVALVICYVSPIMENQIAANGLTQQRIRKKERRIAYFSMEIGLEPEMPTYSGGLGVLAGDTIKSAADLKVPLVAVTLIYRKGYFRQKIDATGAQRELPYEWNPAEVHEAPPPESRRQHRGPPRDGARMGVPRSRRDRF